MKSSWNRCVRIAFVVELVAVSAAADTVALAPSRDTTIYSESENSNGGGQHFFAGRTIHGYYRRSLIGFDIGGNVPPGSTIQSVSLTLHMSMTNSEAIPITVSLYRLLSDWGEGTRVGLSGEGGGARSETGDATWTYRFFNISTWVTPGAGHVATPSASTLVSNTIGFDTWESTAGLVDDVQSWLDARESNFGWELVADQELTPVITAKRFDSRENLNPEFRPVLQVVYAPPLVADGGSTNDGGEDAGAPDAGGVLDGGQDAGLPDSGLGDGGTSAPDAGPSIVPSNMGGGCQVASGSFVAIFAAMLAMFGGSHRRVHGVDAPD